MTKLTVAFSNIATDPKNKELEENEAHCRVFSFPVVQNRNKQNKLLLGGHSYFLSPA